MLKLQPPFLMEETEHGNEKFFLPSEESILNDSYDILWDEKYIGYDSEGVMFHAIAKEIEVKVLDLIKSKQKIFEIKIASDRYSLEQIKDKAMECVGYFAEENNPSIDIAQLSSKSLKEIFDYGIQLQRNYRGRKYK